MSTQDTNHPTDPTPRTAATARERVEEEREHLVALEMADRFAIAIGGTAELSEDDFRAALDHLIALAAEAPGRVTALLRRGVYLVQKVEWENPTDQVDAESWVAEAWQLSVCVDPRCPSRHEEPMPDDCLLPRALAAPASPAGVSWHQQEAEYWAKHTATAPAPSDPVERAEAMVPAWMLARTYSLLPVDRVALVDDEVNEAIARYLDSTLAAPAPTPSEPVECVGCAEHGIHHPSGTPITHRSSAPAPTPSEPVERVRAEYEAWLDEAIAKAKRWRDAGTLTESEYAAAMAVLFVTDAKPTDEEMERIRAMCIERGWTAAPAPTPSEPVGRCGSEHDWETRHPGDLAVCRRCWTVESDTTPATRDE